ncbi:AMP-binding protein [Plantactinospora sp. KBS50]|uniref:AMP-binding protein n=1 Tax=Plantactinospora sp. KBS50 TaxID=2024580 RepID=UPI000BAAC8AE|nr:AMP-binding protein [Plantactinospora sp. KBS50]ASW54320.1 hypothetical protein CIK06_09130 [Plantactinospora sp. KBS50]
MAGREHTCTDLSGTGMTVSGLLHRRAADQPDRIGYTFLLDGEGEEQPLTYAGTDLRARAVAASLRAAGARPGSRALLVLPPGLDYLTALFGCLYAGVVAVPVYPPDPVRLTTSLPRLLAIVRDAEPEVAVTTSPLLGFLDQVTGLAPELGALRWVAADTAEAGDAETGTPVPVAADATAILQYTSGSTADPRGVRLSHHNLLHNSDLIQRLFGTTPESRGMVWLPPYHDMGLIGGLLQPLYGGFPITLMSPLDFLADPMRWLRAIDRSGATVSGGPNFAYDLCARKCDPQEAARLDLRSWRVAFNGAEPIRPETLERFAATFEPAGFHPDAFLPCYGLAEATLIVSGHGGRSAPATTTGAPPTVTVDRTALERHDAAAPGAGPAARLTSCGPSAPGLRIEIVDPATATGCPPGRVGEIWVSGASVAGGYWRRPEETERTFRARLAGTDGPPFLRTGDLGFLHDGQLVVTGRLKDLIIVRGQNHYPQDIERTAEQVDPVLRPGCTAAFLLGDEDDRPVLVHEIRRGSEGVDVADLATRIRQAVARQHGLDVRAVVLVRAGGMPKTSSGKVQRRLCRSRLRSGDLPEVGRDETPAPPAGTAGTGTADGGDGPAGAAVPAAQVLAAPPEQRPELLERYLRGRLAEVTGAAPADRNQPLLAVGLDSLAVVQLKHRVDSELGVSLPLPALLSGAGLAEVAGRLAEQLGAAGPTVTAAGTTARTTDPAAEAAQSGEADPAADPARTGDPAADPARTGVPAGEAVEVAPMSAGQRWTWFLHQIEPDSTAFTIAVALRVLDPLDGAALHRALDTLVARHAALRTTFQVRNGEPVQVVAPSGSAGYREHDAGRLDEGTLRTVLTRVARTPFDLASGPLLRVDRYRRPTGDVLLLSMDHMVTDFWSLTVLARELGALYQAYTSGGDVPLDPPAASYADAARWQRSLLEDPAAVQRLTRYWDGQLAGAVPRLALPPARAGGGRGARRFAVPAPLAAQLRDRACADRVTLYVLLLASFQAVLHRVTGQPDLVVGIGVAGRTRPEFADVVGCFTRPVIVRSHCADGEPFPALLARTRDGVIGALEHQDYPMAMLAARRKLAPHTPLYDVLFTFNRSPRHGDDLATLAAVGPAGVRRTLGPLRVESFPLPAEPSALPVELVMAELDGVPHGVLRYRADALDDATADDLVAGFLGHLAEVAEGLVPQTA